LLRKALDIKAAEAVFVRAIVKKRGKLSGLPFDFISFYASTANEFGLFTKE